MIFNSRKKVDSPTLTNERRVLIPRTSAAISCSQDLLGWRRAAEDGACCLHREDKVEVGDHHGDARQKGKPEPKTTDAAAEGCRNPVDESGKKGAAGCCRVTVTHKQEVTKTAGVSPSKGKDDCQERDELQLLLAQVHGQDDQLQEVDQEERGGV